MSWISFDAHHTPAITFVLGTDPFARDFVLKKFMSLIKGDMLDFNFDRVEAKQTPPESIHNIANRAPMMSPYRLIVIDEGEQYAEVGAKKLMGVRIPKTTKIVVLSTKRLRISDVQDEVKVLHIKKLYGKDLRDFVKYISTQEGVPLGRGDSQLIGNKTGGNPQRVVTMLKLIKHLDGPVDERLAQVSLEESFDSFNIVDAVLAKDRKRAFTCFFSEKEKGASPLSLVGAMFYTVKLCLMSEAMRTDYIPEYKKEGITKLLKGFGIQGLLELSKELHELDFAIKCSDDRGLVENFIIRNT